MILTAWCYLKLTVTKTNLMELKENKTAALLGEEDSLEMKDKVFDLVLLCPFISSDDVDLYGYMAPTLVLLAFNSFFLFWIMGVSFRKILVSSLSFDPQIVLSKLRSQTAMDHDRKHLKAAKALVIVIPLFGFTYILTFIGPDEVRLYSYKIVLTSSLQREFPLGYTIFQSFRAIFLSTTGFVITLPYCYCNSEVRRALTTRYSLAPGTHFQNYSSEE